MENDAKILIVETGSSKITIQLAGVLPAEPLTPKMARQAARAAFGHNNRVTVWDDASGYGYRLYQYSARKLHSRKLYN